MPRKNARPAAKKRQKKKQAVEPPAKPKVAIIGHPNTATLALLAAAVMKLPEKE